MRRLRCARGNCAATPLKADVRLLTPPCFVSKFLQGVSSDVFLQRSVRNLVPDLDYNARGSSLNVTGALWRAVSPLLNQRGSIGGRGSEFEGEVVRQQ